MPTFHFNNYELGTRCNLQLALEAQGFTRSLYRHTADFNEDNLSLDNEALLHLERKDLLWKLLESKKMTWMPRSLVWDEDNKEACLEALAAWKAKESDLVWIAKPAMLNNGVQIKLFDTFDSLVSFFHSREYLRGPYVIQQYITNPHLHAGCKYAYRLFVIVTNETGCYLSPHGYANISREFYSKDHWQDRKMHITNLMLDGVMTDILQLKTDTMGGFAAHYPQIQHIVTEVMNEFFSQFPTVIQKQSKSAFELLGFDFSCDAEGRVWLLEVNHGPDCPRPVDNHPLYDSFWVPFWESIAQEFVLPMIYRQPATHTAWQKIVST
jgi:hypothetical protein